MSVFDLTTDSRLPPVNQGVSQYKYDKVTPTRGATNADFPGGPIDFQFSMAGNKWWIPSRSYFRVRVSIGTAANPPLLPAMGAGVAAPVINPVAALFQQGSVYLEDMEMSKLTSYFAEVDTMKKRQGKSGFWLDNYGDSIDVWDPDFQRRLARVSPQGSNIDGAIGTGTFTVAVGGGGGPGSTVTLTYAAGGGALLYADYNGIFRQGDVVSVQANPREFMEVVSVSALVVTCKALTTVTAAAAADTPTWLSRGPVNLVVPSGANQLEFIWKPSFSVMEIEHGLPVGNYKIELVPAGGTSYLTRFIQGLTALDISVGGDAFMRIDNIDFYAATVIGPRMKTGTYYLDLDETSVQVEAVPAAGGAQEANLTVSRKSYAFTVAFQDSAAGSSTLYPTTQFTHRTRAEKTLTQLQLEYAGQNKPAVQADPSLTASATTGVQRFTQRYNDTYLYNSMAFDSTGPESFENWLDRGPFYYFPFPRDDEDESTRLIVRYTLGTATTMRMLLFSHYKSIATIQVQDGRVTDVRVNER